MKKGLKIIGWTLFSVFLIALVLPFIVSEQNSEKDGPNMNITGPQVYSSNPFTNMMDRLRNRFGSKRGIDVTDEDASETLLSDGKNSKNNYKNKHKKRASLKRNKKNNKFAKGAGKSETSQQNGASASAQDPLNLPETNDWVLGEQTMPLVSAKGMHETKLTDPVYARQKAAQEAGKLLEPKDEIPAAGPAKKSKSGGIFSPIKNWLGIGERKADKQAGTAGRNAVSATRTGSKGNNASSGSNNIKPFDRQSAVNDINNMINSIATMRADAKYPNPKTAKEREARDRMIKEEMRNETIRLNKNFVSFQQKIMEEKPQEQQSVDVVQELLSKPLQLLTDNFATEAADPGKFKLDYLKHVRAVPWKTHLEELLQGNTNLPNNRSRRKEPKEELENSILLVYGPAMGENGRASFITPDDYALLDPNSDVTIDSFTESKLKDFANKKQDIKLENNEKENPNFSLADVLFADNDKEQSKVYLVDLLYNNHFADMVYFYRDATQDHTQASAPQTKENSNNTQDYWWVSTPQTKENSVSVGPLVLTMRMMGADFAGVELDEQQIERYKQDFKTLQNSPKIRASREEKKRDMTEAILDKSQYNSEKEYQETVQVLLDVENANTNYDEDKEYEKQAIYNLKGRSMTLVSGDKLRGQNKATKAIYRGDFLKLAAKENEENEHRDKPTNFVTDYIVLDNPVSSFKSAREMAVGLSKAWENDMGFALRDLSKISLQMNMQQQNQNPQIAIPK